MRQLTSLESDRDRSAWSTGLGRVQHQVLKRAMQKIGIGINFRERFVQEIFSGDSGLAHRGELRFEEANGFAQLTGWSLEERRILFAELESLRRLAFLSGELNEFLACIQR